LIQPATVGNARRCHSPRRRGIQYAAAFRLKRHLWDTESPAGACHRAARCADPVAGDDMRMLVGIRSVSLTIFNVAAGHNSRLERPLDAVPATNRQWFWPRIWASKGSGNADSQLFVRSSGWSGHGCPRDSGCVRAHPRSWRASASYRPLRAVWAVCAWALRGSREITRPFSAY
jgi:hypothetical protein